jgi:hypothetical protein
MTKYRDISPDFAEATLCFVAGREGLSTIFTPDRRDFSIYRSPQNMPFRLLPEQMTG